MLTSLEKTMLGFIVVFLASALWPKLPHYSLIAFVFALLILSLYYKLPPLVNGLLLGFLWACISIHYFLDAQINTNRFNHNVIVVGEVASIVHNPEKEEETLQENSNNNIKFNFLLKTLGTETQWFKPKIRLSWYKPSLQLYQGQQLRLFIRLKAPIGLGNPDGFNYQQWLTSKNIVATGYVIASASNRIIEKTMSSRQGYIERMLQADVQHLPWILALSYGDRSLLSQENWRLMQTTGTAHLFAISGMHLGIVYAFVFTLLKILLYFPLRLLGVQCSISASLLLVAAIVASFYAFIAGFEVPVMRALIALLIWTSLRLLGLHWRMTSIFLILLVMFFVLFPFAHLGVSYWFSFGAVMLIWFFTWRFPMHCDTAASRSNSKFSEGFMAFIYGIRLQLFLSVVTLPIIALVFGILPISSFFANLFMIPLVTFIFVPICLLVAILIGLNIDTHFVLTVLNTLFDYTLTGLKALSLWGSVSSASWPLTQSTLLLLGLIGFCFLLPPGQIRTKRVSTVLLLVCIALNILSWQHALRNQHKWELLAFDVGQGTSIVVKRQSKYLIYDTGPAFRGGFSMAQAVLYPYFERMGMPAIDFLVLSHFDNDHSGGAYFLEQNMQIHNTLSPANTCTAYQQQKWQGLHLEILWPLSPQSGDENNHSCVIKLSSSSVSILFAGDIEKSAEANMRKTYQHSNKLQADVLIAPHHGSKSSSTEAFVKAVSPKYVIITAGYNNRWGFPAQQVVQRYINVKARLLNTGMDGRILLQIDKNKITPSRYRQDELARWYFQARLYDAP